MRLDWGSLTEGLSYELRKSAQVAASSSAPTQTSSGGSGSSAPITGTGKFSRGVGALGAVGGAMQTASDLQSGNLLGAGVNAAGTLASAAQMAPGTAAKMVGGKVLSKFIPGAYAAMGGYDAYNRFRKGDYLGGAISGLGAGASLLFPGAGGFIGLGADALNAARDNGAFSKAKEMVSNAVDSINPVKMVKNTISETMQSIVQGVQQMAPLALATMSQMSSPQAAQPPVININTGKKPNMLDYDTQRIGNFEKMSNLKLAGILSDTASHMTRRKLVDAIQNQLMDNKPEVAPVGEPELEIVTKYPEMAAILEDPKNKQYLNKLLT